MGCAASTTVNTADDVKPALEVLSSDLNASPKLNPDSGDIEISGNTDYGNQIENDRGVIMEETNFHNSPAMSIPDHPSTVSITKSLSNSNRRSESVNIENEKSFERKSDFEIERNLSQPLENHSTLSSPQSTKHSKVSENISRVSSVNKIEAGLSNNRNSCSELQETVETVDNAYKMISRRESQKSNFSSCQSNVVYKPTASSDEEMKASNCNSMNPHESQREIKFANNPRSVVSESKTYENQPGELLTKDPKRNSNANSLNNIEYEKSSRNSQFSHTYTGSVHSPFFDSLNHGNTNYEIDENQNHDETTEPINERIILGTGDSEKWTDVNQNYMPEERNISSIKSNNREIETSFLSENMKANLSATGDICYAQFEQSTEDNTLDIENNQLHNDLMEDHRRFSDNNLNNFPHSTNHMYIADGSNHNSLQTKYLKTAEVNDTKFEGTLIGLTSSSMDFNDDHVEQSPGNRQDEITTPTANE